MSVRWRFWIEVFVAAAATGLTVVTIVLPDWIEKTIGIDPDGGNGVAEVVIAVAVVAVFIISGALARRELRREGTTAAKP